MDYSDDYPLDVRLKITGKKGEPRGNFQGEIFIIENFNDQIVVEKDGKRAKGETVILAVINLLAKIKA